VAGAPDNAHHGFGRLGRFGSEPLNSVESRPIKETVLPRTSSKPAGDISSIVPSSIKDEVSEMMTNAAQEHREDLLDEALEESFPASDPIGPQSID